MNDYEYNIYECHVCAMKKLRRHMAASPHDIRDIRNLIVDSYCFRAKDIKKMDFFKLRLDRLLENAHERLATMESLLSDCWWEELAGFGACFHFNKTVAKQLVKLYAKLLDDLRSMKFAIEGGNMPLDACYTAQEDANAILRAAN